MPNVTALDEMVAGYLDGFNASADELPPAAAGRGPAYSHGWKNGRDDRCGKPRDRADVLRRRADLILSNVEPRNDHKGGVHALR